MMSDIDAKAPRPHDCLVDEGGAPMSWLASAWDKQDIIEEWDWLDLIPEGLSEEWWACRWTTPEERADPDALYDLFGADADTVDTSVYYWRAVPGASGAHLYWSTG